MQPLFDAPEPFVEFGNQHAMPDCRRMIFDDGAAKADDLFTSLFLIGGGRFGGVEEIGRHISAQAANIRSYLGTQSIEFIVNPAQQMKNEIFGTIGHGAIQSAYS